MIGYIYVLINPSLQGMVKIGKTTRNPEDRAKELSNATGVPTPFIVGYSVIVSDCDAAEKFVHELLSLQGARLTKNREFFEITLSDAVKVLTECEGIYSVLDSDVSHQSEEDEDHLGDEYGSSYRLYAHLLKEARNYRNGEDGFFEDHIEAENQYKKAIKLGSIEAAHELATLYYSSQEIFNMKKSLELAKKTIDMIADFRSNSIGLSKLYVLEIFTLKLLAIIYFYEEKISNSEKAIMMIFEKYRDAFSATMTVLSNVKLVKKSAGFNSVVFDGLRSHTELKFFDIKEQDDYFDISKDFNSKCDGISIFIFYYFQDVTKGILPLVDFDILRNNINHVTKLKMDYYFDYDMYHENILAFDAGINKYKSIFCSSSAARNLKESSDVKGSSISTILPSSSENSLDTGGQRSDIDDSENHKIKYDNINREEMRKYKAIIIILSTIIFMFFMFFIFKN